MERYPEQKKMKNWFWQVFFLPKICAFFAETYLQFPKQRTRMTMVVISQRKIFGNGLTLWHRFQDLLNMLKEPWLVPFAHIVNLFDEIVIKKRYVVIELFYFV